MLIVYNFNCIGKSVYYGNIFFSKISNPPIENHCNTPNVFSLTVFCSDGFGKDDPGHFCGVYLQTGMAAVDRGAFVLEISLD